MSNTVNVRTFGSEIEAEIAKEVLAANGIKSSIVADDMGGWFPKLTPEVKLAVMEEDAELAREILNSTAEEPKP